MTESVSTGEPDFDSSKSDGRLAQRDRSTKVFEQLLSIRKNRGAGYFVLIDPDKWQPSQLPRFAQAVGQSGADAILIGGSLLLTSSFDEIVQSIRAAANTPCLIFPGSTMQISRHADAILFLSLVSGRNPTYLIGEQVKAAPVIKHLGVESIPTGYILIESGHVTSAEFMSDTRAIPRDKIDIAKATALAAEYLGMKMVYLEAGSGAEHSVSAEMIRAVSAYVNVPIIVGGGIRTPEQAATCVRAGASFVVTGNVLEKQDGTELMRAFADAIHHARTPSTQERG